MIHSFFWKRKESSLYSLTTHDPQDVEVRNQTQPNHCLKLLSVQPYLTATHITWPPCYYSHFILDRAIDQSVIFLFKIEDLLNMTTLFI